MMSSGSQIDATVLKCSVTATPAGMKKKAMFDRRKSLFSLIWSIFSHPVNSAAVRSSIAVTEEGKVKGSRALMISPSRQSENIMAV